MDKLDIANEIVDKIFDEGFEIFGKKVSAMKKVDELLLAEKESLPKPASMDKTYMDIVGRPYDNPNQFKLRSDNIDVEFEDEQGLGEDWPYGMGEPIEDDVPPDDTYDDLEKQEPAEDEDPKKLQNKINTVPNQSLSAMMSSLRKEFGGKPAEDEISEMMTPSEIWWERGIARCKKMAGGDKSKFETCRERLTKKAQDSMKPRK